MYDFYIDFSKQNLQECLIGFFFLKIAHVFLRIPVGLPLKIFAGFPPIVYDEIHPCSNFSMNPSRKSSIFLGFSLEFSIVTVNPLPIPLGISFEIVPRMLLGLLQVCMMGRSYQEAIPVGLQRIIIAKIPTIWKCLRNLNKNARRNPGRNS